MDKASYSNNISKLATIEQARERYKLSRNLLLKIAEDNGAVHKIGRAVRIDVPAMDILRMEKRRTVIWFTAFIVAFAVVIADRIIGKGGKYNG